MDLDEFRKQNPAYADQSLWPDTKLASGLYNKYYKNKMTEEEFNKKLYVTPTRIPKESPPGQENGGREAPTKEPAEGWKAYADKINADIASEADKPLDGALWVDPTFAATMPGAMGLSLGKGLAKTAAMVTASLLAEPAVGTGMQLADEAMTEKGVPMAIKLPTQLALGMVSGTLAESGIMKLGSLAKQALKGAPVTVDNVGKALQSMNIESGTDVIQQLTKVPAKPLDMKTAVTEITKRSAIPEIKAEDVIAPVTKDSAVKEAAKSKTADSLTGMALGAGAGVDIDENGRPSFDGKMTLLGVTAGAIAGTAASKILTSTRLPGIKGGVKQEVKATRSAAKILKTLGNSDEAVFKQTGMLQGPEGRWLQELDDSVAKTDLTSFLSKADTKLKDIITEHPELYRRYPQLQDMPIKMLDPKNKSSLGSYQRGTDPIRDVGVIHLNPSYSQDELKEALFHETQHAVQYIEGLERGGSRMELVNIHDSLRALKKDTEVMLKSATPEIAKDMKQNLKSINRKLDYIGLNKQSDISDSFRDKIDSLGQEGKILRTKIQELRDQGLDVKDTKKLLDNVSQQIMEAQNGLRDSDRDLYSLAFKRYESIAGEQAARFTMNRLKMSADMRRQSMMTWSPDTIMMSKLNSGQMATTGVIGGVFNGVDWDTFEETGRVEFDPNKAFRGALMGMAVGTGMHIAPKAAETWTRVTKEKVLDPLVDIAKGSITNETMRYQLGLDRSPEVAALIKDYKIKSELVLRKSIAIGREINEIAPGSLQQKRLTQILEGGVTTNPILASKAHKINAMFADLKESTRALNLSQYSRFDELTRKQRADLRGIIKNTETPEAERITAQTMLNNHYHIGSSSEYLPIFNPGIEGMTKMEKAAVKSEIDTLKHKSRLLNPEGDPVLEPQIAQLEKMLTGKSKPVRTKGTTLDLGYSTMRQDLPTETVRVFNDIIGPAYRVAKGAATQGTDVLKQKLLDHVSKNSEWVLPAGTPHQANYTKLLGNEWGSLNGKRVRRDVLSDLEDVIDVRSNAEYNMDKIMGYWKYGKAILNPATHARNFVSNLTLAHLAGVSPADTVTYASAAKALKQGRDNVYFREAEDSGLFNSTFLESDVSVLRDELNMVRNPNSLANWIRKAASVPATMYDQSERFFKTAVFIKAREEGKSAGAAAEMAEKYLFNYQDIPPVVKHYKRWASPFVTYAYKASPLLAETMITKPWKIAGVMGAMYGLEEIAQKKLGVEDETVKGDKSVMLKSRGQVLLPFTDTNDNRLYANMGDFMPWSGVGQAWGQSDIPFSDFMPNNPIFTLASAIMTNKDSFTGKEIHDKVLDSAAETTQKYMEYAWKQLTPSLAPGGYGFDKLVSALKNMFGADIKDYTGQVKDPSTLAMSALMGVKLTKANQQLFDQFSAAKMRQLQKLVSTKRMDIMKQVKRNEISEDEANEKMQALRDLHMDKQSTMLE